jgi:hypothetical protein
MPKMNNVRHRLPHLPPSPVDRFYSFLLDHSRTVLFCLLAGIAILAWCAKDFQIDASSDTLINEGDADIQYARKISARYDIQDFLIIAYTPREDLLSPKVLADIGRLKSDISALPGVDSVVTLLDVPLLESPPVPIKDLAGGLPTILSPGVDMTLVRKELATSPLYRNLLVSPDLDTTGIQINLAINQQYRDLVARRDGLSDQAATGGLTPAAAADLNRMENEILDMRKAFKARNEKLIADIRGIMSRYRNNADLFLGGVDMIANDLIWFIKNDLKIFGAGVFVFLIIVLGIFFRKIRWVAIPMMCCFFSVIAMTGLLGLFEWKVTVISSNFISLQLILTMSLAIHLIVRYREEESLHPALDHRALIILTMREKLVPCLYATLTTMAGFGSLLLCDLKPVITFGWMMVGGLVVSLVFTFLFFPAALSLFKKTPPPPASGGGAFLTGITSRLTEFHGRLIIAAGFIAFVVSLIGISRLTVENAFVNYFKETTEIYQGMRVIDQELGGTTPFDVILNFPGSDNSAAGVKEAGPAAEADEFDAFSEFEEEDSADHYWFTPWKMDQVLAVHDYLESLPEIGKVLSLGTMLKAARRLNEGRPLDSVELSLVYNKLPEKYRQMLIDPYVSVADNQVRLSVRVVDTTESLRRDHLIKKIAKEISSRFSFEKEDVQLTGMLILYNNVLQSLFDSQILTLGFVLIALMIMFLLLFRSRKVALIAVFPNLLSVSVVLGALGWMNLPLDMMTITIASISVGIAVDDTIHYIHRFREEFAGKPDYLAAMRNCHGSIGYAMYYTSIAIILGFSILAASNFIPTIAFGLLTGLAMLIALLAALTLLPRLIILVKPFGPES